MVKQTQLVELIVENKAGVLDRVVGHIRREGWNIKSIVADETNDPAISKMEIKINGKYSKLERVVDKLIEINCVLKAAIEKDGELIVKEKPKMEEVRKKVEEIPAIGEKAPGVKRILAINPGSTSTKFAVYDDQKMVLIHVTRYDRGRLMKCGPTILDQKELRMQSILDVLKEAKIDLKSFDAIAGRGGIVKPIISGTYGVNDEMLKDLNSIAAMRHPSALGAIIAKEIADEVGIPAYVVDPVVVDEFDQHARISGMPGIERNSLFHALNQKAIARRHAAVIGKPYESCRFVIAHLGGGITIGAHRYGRVIDCNDGLSGEGPFTPERPGSIPIVPLIEMCYSGEYSRDEMLDKVTRASGMLGYLGTNDAQVAEHMISEGDEFAALVVDSMAYQVAKEIAAMCAVLSGSVDAILLTGGIAYSTRFCGEVKKRVSNFAPVYVYPGEDEMEALMSGAMRVLNGEEKAKVY